MVEVRKGGGYGKESGEKGEFIAGVTLSTEVLNREDNDMLSHQQAVRSFDTEHWESSSSV
jgi:hypothetical protein